MLNYYNIFKIFIIIIIYLFKTTYSNLWGVETKAREIGAKYFHAKRSDGKILLLQSVALKLRFGPNLSVNSCNNFDLM